jgi:hypothetical protein
MKQEQVIKWLETKGKMEMIEDKDGDWVTLTFNATIGMQGEFVNFVGNAEVRCSVFPELVLMTVRNNRGEEAIFTFYLDGCHKDRFENESARVEFL